jgi:hypothetical protein
MHRRGTQPSSKRTSRPIQADEIHAMTMVWSGLKRRRWLFEVLPGGDDGSWLAEPSFVVEAFKNG